MWINRLLAAIDVVRTRTDFLYLASPLRLPSTKLTTCQSRRPAPSPAALPAQWRPSPRKGVGPRFFSFYLPAVDEYRDTTRGGTLLYGENAVDRRGARILSCGRDYYHDAKV